MLSLEKITLPISVRRHNRESMLAQISIYSKPGDFVYDIGCGDKPFSKYVRGLGCTYIGVDIADGFYGESPDLIGSASNVPAPNNVADLIISSQVIEHITDPYGAFKEASRLLKPNGIFLYSSPFLYQLHAAPYDYGRYSQYYIKNAADKSGFEIINDVSLCGFWVASATLFANYATNMDRGFLKKTKIVRLIIFFYQWLCYLLNAVEIYSLRVFKKNPRKFQNTWPINNFFIMRKRDKVNENSLA